MADITTSVPLIPQRKALPKLRFGTFGLGQAVALAFRECARAASMVYVLPFGLDAAPGSGPQPLGEDGRDPRW